MAHIFLHAEADSVSQLLVSFDCHSSGPNSVNPGQNLEYSEYGRLNPLSLMLQFDFNLTGSPSTSTLTSANIQGNYCHHDNSFVKQQVPAVTAAAPLPQQQPPKQQSSSRVHKLRTHTNKLRQQTTRIMSNLSKGQSSVLNCTPLRRYQ